MSAPEAALVVAIIGLTGTMAASRVTARATRRGAYVHELRGRTGDAFRQAFAIQHAMEWVTWHAKFEPDLLDDVMKRDYSSEVHTALPALLGAMAAVAALSLPVYRGMQPVLESLYNAEHHVALAMRFVSSAGPQREESINQLSELFNDAQNLYRALPEQVAEIMELAAARK